MTGETIRDLLKPLIGKPGAVHMVARRGGHIGFATSDDSKLTGVEVRPDGLVHLERETGWVVIDPDEVVAVAWDGRSGAVAGPIPVSGASCGQGT